MIKISGMTSSKWLAGVAGNAAVLLAPEDVEGWAQAMLRISGNRVAREHWGTVARVQAALLDWKRSARC